MKEEIIKLLTNPVIIGFLIATITGLITTSLKKIPSSGIGFLKNILFHSIKISNTYINYEDILFYINSLSFIKGISSNVWSLQNKKEKEVLSFGYGKRYIIYNKKLICIDRFLSDKPTSSFSSPYEFIVISVLFGKRKFLENFLEEIKQKTIKEDDNICIKLYSYGWWNTYDYRKKRELSSIFLPLDQKTKIINDLLSWQKSQNLYKEKSLVWKRNYLFFGLPGTGKSTLALGLASLISKDICMISLTDCSNDREFLNICASLPRNSILLIEDIDTYFNNREQTPTTIISKKSLPKMKEDGDKVEVPTGISLSVLLNFLDGNYSKEGQITIMTTNYIDKLDSAIIRPGRVDLLEEIKPLFLEEISAMGKYYLGENWKESLSKEEEKVLMTKEGVIGAKVQEIFFSKTKIF